MPGHERLLAQKEALKVAEKAADKALREGEETGECPLLTLATTFLTERDVRMGESSTKEPATPPEPKD